MSRTDAGRVAGRVETAAADDGTVGGRIVGGALTVALTLLVAVVECFLVPLRAGRWPVPLCVLAAVVGNVALCRFAVLVTGRRASALLPPLVWLVVVLVFAAPRPEGDLVVPGSWVGIAFLFGGAIAGAYGAASSMLPPRRRAAGARPRG